MTPGSRFSSMRAALVLLHMAAISVLALPSTAGLLHRKAWEEASVQAEFATWAGVLGNIGIDLTVPELEEHLWTVATTYGEANEWIRVPLEPYARWMGTGQPWQMFPAPQRRPAVLHIDVKDAGGWQPIYRARSRTQAWNAGLLDQDRMRTLTFLYGWPHIRKGRLFREFRRWNTPRVAADHPDATHVRYRFYRYTTRPPHEAHLEPEGRYESTDIEPLR